MEHLNRKNYHFPIGTSKTLSVVAESFFIAVIFYKNQAHKVSLEKAAAPPKCQ